MNKRVLGRTGIEVSELSLGGAFLTRGEEGVDGAVSIVRRAVELGINCVDTSADYGNSEMALGPALSDLTKPIIVSTKLGPRDQSFDPQNPEHIRRVAHESLELLRRDVLDVLMIHEPDRPGQLDWFDDWQSFHGPVDDVLAELKQEGLIRFTGLGGTTVYELPRIMATGRYDVVLTAFNYSLLWREAAIAVIPEAVKQNMGIMVGSPTQQGWIAQRYDDEVRSGAPWLSPPRRAQLIELYDFVDEIAIPLPELCIRWMINDKRISTVLTGVRNIEQLEQNVKACEEGPLPPDIIERLDEIAAMVPFRPFEEPFGFPFDTPNYNKTRKWPRRA